MVAVVCRVEMLLLARAMAWCGVRRLCIVKGRGGVMVVLHDRW
jgi:hypothetical protein